MFEMPTEEIAMERNTHRETHAYKDADEQTERLPERRRKRAIPI